VRLMNQAEETPKKRSPYKKKEVCQLVWFGWVAGFDAFLHFHFFGRF
jgi:hypothetical protein